MQLIRDYMRNDPLRRALDDLTEKTFGFRFERWVKGGYFERDCIPFSFEQDGRIPLTCQPTGCCFGKTAGNGCTSSWARS